MNNQLWYLSNNIINKTPDEFLKNKPQGFHITEVLVFFKFEPFLIAAVFKSTSFKSSLEEKGTLGMSQTKNLTERSIPARIPDFCRSSSNQRTKWPGSIVAFYRWEVKRGPQGLLNTMQNQMAEKQKSICKNKKGLWA